MNAKVKFFDEQKRYLVGNNAQVSFDERERLNSELLAYVNEQFLRFNAHLASLLQNGEIDSAQALIDMVNEVLARVNIEAQAQLNLTAEQSIRFLFR